MKDFMAASESQLVQVQNVFLRSFRNFTPRLPGAFLTCRVMRMERRKKAGRKIHDLTRRRVTETMGIVLKMTRL